MPTSCTPSMTVYVSSPQVVDTVYLYQVKPPTGSALYPTLVTPAIATCQINSFVNPSPPGMLPSCSVIASSPVSAGTYLTVVVASYNEIGMGGLAFSCQ